jgi:hypothetical protein
VAPLDDEVEAREWIGSGGVLTSDGFANHHNATQFVDALYAAGAVRVTVNSGTTLVATLPMEAHRRAPLFAIYNAEIDRFGEEFGGMDNPGHEMTRAEAAAIGQPEAEGRWVVDDFHVIDTGQLALRFWWD